jgi:hypothetical protein
MNLRRNEEYYFEEVISKDFWSLSLMLYAHENYD